MIVVAVQVSQDLPTVRTDVVLTRNVFALYMFVDVGALVAPVVALHAGPVTPPQVDHLPPGLVVRVDEGVKAGSLVWIMNPSHMFVESTSSGDGLPAFVALQTLEPSFSLCLLVLSELLHGVEYFPAELAGEGSLEMKTVHVVLQTLFVAGLVATELAGEMLD